MVVYFGELYLGEAVVQVEWVKLGIPFLQLTDVVLGGLGDVCPGDTAVYEGVGCHVGSIQQNKQKEIRPKCYFMSILRIIPGYCETKHLPGRHPPQ